MQFDFFKLEKLTILSYKTPARTGKAEAFVAMFNPSSYSLQYQNKFDPNQTINSSGSKAQYSITKPERLKVKLILDGNGVHEFGVTGLLNSERNDVYLKVQEFLKLTTLMDGELHEPRPLKLKWGDLHFKCKLLNVNINYTQFDASGKPLRAELDTEFLRDIEPSVRLKLENKNSPDLTHYRVVGAHDRLPAMCESIYGSPQYYVWVAKANNLNDFRNLTPGQRIYFPPIEK